MEREGDQAGATGAEAARRAAVLRPLVQAYLTGSGSLESGIRDALWELGVSRKAALFSADGDDFSRVALLRAYQKEPRLIAAVDHIAWRLAQRLGSSGLTGSEPTAAKSHN
jgi:hypothetical protein